MSRVALQSSRRVSGSRRPDTSGLIRVDRLRRGKILPRVQDVISRRGSAYHAWLMKKLADLVRHHDPGEVGKWSVISGQSEHMSGAAPTVGRAHLPVRLLVRRTDAVGGHESINVLVVRRNTRSHN